MSNIVSKLGIQSYCFRGFKDPATVTRMLRECGVNRIELCGVHWDQKAVPNPSDALKPYESADIIVSSYGVHRVTEDEAAARPAFEMAKAAGFPTISATLSPGGLPIAERLCKEYGKRIAIHNHGRRDRLGAVWALEELFARASRNVGLCLDTAWMLDSGEDPLKVADKFRDRLYGLHVKDFVFNRAGKPEDVIVGSGNLNLDALAAFLAGMGFDGYLTLEYEGDVENPVPALRKCVEAIRASFAKAG